MSDQPRIALALSGGGHRACLWGLGVLLYLADAGRNADVTSIASVSGGSLANAAIGSRLDYPGAGADDVEDAVRGAARAASRGTVFRWWGTWVYLLLLLAFLPVVVAVTFVKFSLPSEQEVGVLVLAVLVWLWLTKLRGRVCGRAFAHTMFGGSRQLSELSTALDQVICATDLHAGEHVYFSGRFVASYRFGLGEPNGLALHRAVQASAAFPPVFPVSWIRTRPFKFQQPGEEAAAKTRALALTDGGVYDNMADQWAQGLADRARRWSSLSPGFREADELVVANASAGLAWGRTWTLRLPLLGELLALLRDKSVLYDNGTSVRRQQLVSAFRIAEAGGGGPRGALVHIEQSPFKVPDSFAEEDNPDPGRSARARAATAALGGDDEERARADWRGVAAANAGVATTLVGLGEDASARLLHHSYTLAMVNLHVLLDYPLLEIPARARFAKLLQPEA